MDKRNSKRSDQTKPEKKDRGDNLKKAERTLKKLLDSIENVEARNPGGDSEVKPSKFNKPKAYKKSDDVKLKVDHRVSRENLGRRNDRVDEAVKLDKDGRKKHRDQCALKVDPSHNPVLKKDEAVKINFRNPGGDAKNDRPSKKSSELKSKIELSTDSAPSEHKADKKRDSSHRKPLIKTVTSKNDATKVFKAVNFIDHKVKPAALQIKIPNEENNLKNNTKVVSTNTEVKKIKTTVSRVSVEENHIGSRRKLNKRKKREKKHYVSPDRSVKMLSPPTEVAKWAPSSINKHTKPYYEAWVNTTLAAISKNARKDKSFLEKQSVLKTLQKVLDERPDTPDLVYKDITDERFTGRIRVIRK